MRSGPEVPGQAGADVLGRLRVQQHARVVFHRCARLDHALQILAGLVGAIVHLLHQVAGRALVHLDDPVPARQQAEPDQCVERFLYFFTFLSFPSALHAGHVVVEFPA